MMEKKYRLWITLFWGAFIVLLMSPDLSGQTVSDTNFSGAVGFGARALGMGGAFIAIADDATAASWNPAGLSQLEKPELTIVFRRHQFRHSLSSLFSPYAFQGPKDFNGESYSLDFGAFTFPIRIGELKLTPQICYQRNVSYDIDTRANHIRTMGPVLIGELANLLADGYADETERYRGGVDNVALSLGVRLFDPLHVGVSVNKYFNGFDGWKKYTLQGTFLNPLSMAETTETFELTEKLKTLFSGYNINVGVLLKLGLNLKFGAVYKSAFSAGVDIEVSRQADWNGKKMAEMGGRQTATLHWPETWGVGIAYAPSDPLTFSVDYTHTRWSKGKLKGFYDMHTQQYYDLYFPTFSQVNLTPELIGENKPQTDSSQLRFGAEYVIIGSNFLVPVRVGYFSDVQYFPDAGGDRVIFYGLTVGWGYKKGHFSVDTALIYEFGEYIRNQNDYSFTRFSELRAYISSSYSF